MRIAASLTRVGGAAFGCDFLATSSELLDVKSVPDAIRPASYNFNDRALNNVW
jgi:hypothetical protein